MSAVEQDKPLTAIAEYNATAAALADLEHRYKGVVFDVATREGMATAIKGRAELRGYRVALEKKRVEIKAPALERTRLIDAEAKRLTAALSALEDPIDEAIQTEQTRKEREREEREKAEAARIAAIQAEIAGIDRIPSTAAGAPSSAIESILGGLRTMTVSAQEFQALADAAKARAIAALEQLHAGALAQEKAKAEEEARIKAEREELARLRAEQVERDRQEQARVVEENRKRAAAEAEARAKIEAAERESRARIEAEERAARVAREEEDRKARAIAEEQRKTREAEEAKAKAIRDAEEARQRAERERLAEESRALAEQQRQAKEREAAAQREIERAQIELMDGNAMLAKFVERFGKRKEFAPVVRAITAYLQPGRKEAA